MFLHHLADAHRAEAQPYLTRMATEDIETVVMEVFEQVPADDSGSG
jgi:hypothetical protein